MAPLKRKDAPGGDRSEKSAKKTKENGTKAASGKDAKAAKPTTKSTDRPKSVVSVLKDEEPMFPRGGGSVLTPLEQKQIQAEAKADAKREDEFDTGKKGTKKKKAAKASAKGGKKGAATEEEEDSVKVESLSFKVGSYRSRRWT